MGTDEILVLGGVLAVLAGAVGGGVSLAGGTVPLLSTRTRQCFVFVVGVVLLTLGLFPQLRQVGAGASEQVSTEIPVTDNEFDDSENRRTARPVRDTGSATDNSPGGSAAASNSAEAQQRELGVLEIRSRMRNRVREVSSTGDAATLRRMAIAIGLVPSDGATVTELRDLLLGRIPHANTLEETRELARRLEISVSAD